MGINRFSYCSLIVISCLIVRSNRQPVHDVYAKTSEYSVANILAYTSNERKTVNPKKVEDPLYGEYTEEEIDMMAVICYREARGEGIEGMRLVADVILNRVDSDEFPDQNTIKDVISYPGAFSTYREGDMEEPEITIDCYGAVLAELQERKNTEILYFTSGGYSPWGTPVFKYKNHYFSK